MNTLLAKSREGDFIEVTVGRDMNRAAAVQMYQEAHEFGRKHGLRCYLIDLLHSVNRDSVNDNYTFAYDHLPHAVGIDPTAVIALLVGKDDKSHDFEETVNRNSGANITLFRDRGAAIDYLNKNPEDCRA